MIDIEDIGINSNIEVLAPGIHLYKGVFNAHKFLEELEKECESEWSSVQWNYSFTDKGTASDYRSSLSCSLECIMDPAGTHPLHSMFKNEIYNPIYECVSDYMRCYEMRNGIHEMMQILKYSNGAQYRAHWDHAKSAPRIFSLVAFLSGPKNGGELEFPHFKITVPAETGSLILFPSNHPYLHIAHPVYEGVKYSLVTWF